MVLLLGAAGALWGAGRLPDGPAAGGALAMVALAGAGGTVAVGGWGKRVVGGLVALAGLLAGVQVVAAGTGPGRWVALLGAVLLVVAGVLVVRAAADLPTLGARYRSAGRSGGSADPDRDLWDGLSEGRDPTLGETAGRPVGKAEDEGPAGEAEDGR